MDVNNTSTQKKILRHKSTGLYFNGYGFHESNVIHAMRFDANDDCVIYGELIEEIAQ